jgi:hypothetical protein
MTTIDLVYFDAGGGHRAAALALQAAIREQDRPWRVRLVHLVHALDPARRFERVTGHGPEHLYNWRLRRGWTMGLRSELRVLQGLIRLGQPSVDQHIVCGTERAAAQARDAGCRADRIHRTSGMPIRPEFYRPRRTDRRAERLALGLDPDRPTGIVMFGGQGSAQMTRIARGLADRQLILLCGRDEALAASLRALRREAPHAVLGFTSDVRRYMDIADFFIGKPGPGALSEALHCGLPVLTFRNAWTMPQERYNAQWVVEQGVGLVVDSTRTLAPAVRTLLADLDRYRARTRRLRNRAVFETPAILQRLLAARPMPARDVREPLEATP